MKTIQTQTVQTNSTDHSSENHVVFSRADNTDRLDRLVQEFSIKKRSDKRTQVIDIRNYNSNVMDKSNG